MRPATALLLVFVLIATAGLAVAEQKLLDPFAAFRGPDGSLHIPGSALTNNLLRALFGPRPDPNAPIRLAERVPSPYPTLAIRIVEMEFPQQPSFRFVLRIQDIIGSVNHGLSAAANAITAIGRAAIAAFFNFLTSDAAAAVNVDTTTVADVFPAATTCTTSQSATAADNGVLVMLSERGTTTFASVTYGSTSLTLVAGTAANGGTVVRTEIWGFTGTLPGGLQTMTATLSGGQTAKMSCATILLQGVSPTGSFIRGTNNAANSTNASVTLLGTVAVGNLAFAVAVLQQTNGGAQPTAVTGTGATATDLYGVAVGHCTTGASAASNECAAGSDIPNPGTAITWTNAATQWVVSAVEVVAAPPCGNGSGLCYRIGNGGAWNSASNWSNSSGGAPCSCTPAATDVAVFNANPTGTVTLAAATTIGGIDMTGFTGTLDTTAANSWALTVNGNFLVQGTFLAENSAVSVSGNVGIVSAGTIVNLGGSTWTVNGTWTNASTSSSWVAGTSTVTIADAGNATLTFAALTGGTNEFNNMTLDSIAIGGAVYTMAINAVRIGAVLTVRNSTAGATGPTILDTSGSNLAVTAGSLALSLLGSVSANGSTVTINGNVTVGAAGAYSTMGTSVWTVTGTWTNASTSASWSAGTSTVTFTSATGGTMTFAGSNLAGSEFYNVAFASSAASAQTFTMSTRGLNWGGTLTVSDASSSTQLATANLSLTGGGLVIGNGGILTANASSASVSSVSMTGGTSGTITLTTGTVTDSGNWDTSGAGSVFTKGTSTVTMTGVSNIAVRNASNNFNNLTISTAGAVTQTGLVDVSGTLGVNAGATLATGTQTLTVGVLAANMAGGITAGPSGTKTIGGNVSIAAAGFFNFGGATWNFSGAWTNASTSASWAPGTGNVVFRDAASQTMTFKASGTEFPNLTLDTTAVAGITYTMATNPLNSGGTLTIQNSVVGPTGNTILTTGASGLGITAAGITIGINGTLTASSSTITDNGNWTSTATNATLNKGTSTVIFGAMGTITLAAGQSFNNMTQGAGTSTLGAALTVTGLLTVNGTLSTSASNFALTAQGGLTVGGSVVAGTSTVAVTGSVNISVAAGFITSSAVGSWTVTNGNWTNASTSASWNFAAPITFTSSVARTMTFAGANLSGNEFAGTVTFDSSVAAGVTYTMASRGLVLGGSVLIRNTAGGATGYTVLDSSPSNLSLTVGSLSLASFGAINTRLSTVAVGGSVTMGAPNTYVTNAGGSWTVSGPWTNASTSASWSFAAPIMFNSSASQTMTFASLTQEFTGNVTFNSGAATVTYTMASNALTTGGTLTVSGGAGTTTLSTSSSNLPISAVALNVGAGGSLAANGSLITVTSVDTHLGTFAVGTSTVVIGASGGTVNVPQTLYNLTVNSGINTTFVSNLAWSAILTLTGAVPTLNGNLSSVGPATLTMTSSTTSIAGSWNTSSTVALASTGSSVTFTGAAQTITLGVSQQFNSLTIAGSISVASNLTATSLTVNVGSTLTKTGHTIVFNSLTVNGTIADGSVNVSNLTVTNSDGTALVTISVFSGWTTGSSYAWTHTSNEASQTITWTIGGNVVGNQFNVTKNGSPFASGTVSGSGQVVFTMLGSDPTMQVSLGAPCAANRYWVQGNGNWNDTNHWSGFSGGGFGCSVPGSSNAVFFDGSSGSATVTINANASMASLNTTGFSGTIAIGVYDVSIGGNVIQAGGTITIGASNGNGLAVNGSLTLSGTASIQMSGASNGSVSGNVTISSPTAFIAFGSGTWTVIGSWSNSSSSNSWAAGTGTVVFAAGSPQVMTFGNLTISEFYDIQIRPPAATTFTMATNGLQWSGTLTLSSNATLVTANLALTGGNLIVGNGAALTAGTSAVGVANVAMTGGTSGTITASGSWTVSGNWDTSGAGSAFVGTSATVLLTGNGVTVRILDAANGFGTLTITGSVSAASAIVVAALLTVNGTFDTTAANYALTMGGGLTLGGANATLRTQASNVSITGNVTVANASGVIGSASGGSWIVSGSWTNASSSASWSFSAPITFNSSSARSMMFAALPSGNAEFVDVTFDGGASTVTYTMAANTLVWSGTLRVQGGSGTTTLVTANLGLAGGSLTIGNAGILMASGSPVIVSNVTVTGGSSGVIIVTSGSWTVLGNWDSSGVGSILTAGTSTMTFAGTSKTISLAPVQAFNRVTIAGTTSMSSTLTAATLTVNSGAILTKTGHGIVFNALTVNGTIADGSVNVSNLTVTNSDGTALVTISLFSGWSTGSSYAWTHTSSETTQTITWTIGGNTAGNLFNATKDGSSFASGAVNGSGQVVFTMLGSDPDMKVTVTPPPIPAWWQSPYVLAVPPIGVFLVVAMFAQRARWRPAKAFLVDERGRMLREFTLDPSCQVTYDQAVGAGVLDAVEKPIKVAKYHGQTVRGDALAVVLLAYGPVTAEQVGFAREMLVQVQDKFEDAVKQRLEEVRSQEATLQAEAKSVEERQHALEIRASEIESTMKQIEAAQLNVASDKAGLEATEGDLKRREAELAESRRSTDELARQLEEKQKSLETRAVEIAAQSDAVDARTEAIRAREETATALDAELRRRNEAVTSQETSLKNEADRVAAQDSSVRARLEEAERREAGVRDGETAFAANREKFEADQKELMEFKRSIENRVAEVDAAEQSLANREKTLDAREARITPVEADLTRREGATTQLEEDLAGRKVLMQAARKEIAERSTDLETREAALARGTEQVETARRSLETERRTIEEVQQQARQAFEAAQSLEAATLARSKDLDLRETRIAPAERQLDERTKELDARQADLASRDEQLAARAQSLDTATQELGARDQSLQEDQVVLGEARAAFEADRRELQDEVARHESEVRRRKADLDAQAKTLGEDQLRMAQDREAFDASQAEKNQAILSREIELEAREQSLREKEGAVRGQAEENARRLTELAAREESLEIEGAKLDKARAELDARKVGLADVAKELDGKAARLREEEAKRAEELRTWQGTLESEQALLKQQRETFEEEASTMRTAWADRVMRIEAQEVDLEEREERVRGDTDRIARTEEELKRRETAAEGAAQVASQMKEEAERIRRESEQRLLEVESRERALREEAAHHAIELTKETERLNAIESDLAGKRSEFEQLHTARTAELRQTETELEKNAQALDANGRELAERESRLVAREETVRQSELRLQREHEDVQAGAKQLESRELELTQLKDRYDSEAAQIRNELEGMRQSVAAKETELRAERERIERDSSALQETLGAKAKEMALREKALTAREEESRADEQELEARGRELESKERQTEARTTELSAQAMALIRREQDLNTRAAQIEQTVRRVETEAAEKRREWESVQATLRSQQAQLTATAETRAADLAKRTQEVEGRERTQRAWFAQFELERSKVDAQAKAVAAKSAEAEAAWQRSEARLAELKTKENETLRARQAFESERSTWATRRAEELKQLEATRDAAGQQAQQAERLVSESQRRALIAEEAERAAKRQAADLATQQTSLEKRRSEAEKAEHDAQAHIAQLQEASRNLAMKEMNIAAATKDLEARQSRISASEREVASREADLRSKKTSVDQDAARVAALSEQLATRQRDLESRTASQEAKSAQMSSKEQTLATELQRADNLMEDLDKKEREIRARDEALKASEATLTARESEVTARDAELRDGTRGLEKLRQELNGQRAATEEARRVADTTREESEVMKRDAEKLRAQAGAMQAEVATNLRFLQKKALDVLDQEEKIRDRLTRIEERERSLDARAEILEGKERTLTDDQADLDAKTAKLQAEIDRLQGRLADAEKAGGPSTAAMEEWKKDVENRVKIIQKKAMDLLDREEKLRKKEEELRALAEQLGASR
ncbi:MAG: hypothetical protein E6K08_02580 [Methanobacteriota archaeon]|nr:MAG: hypothetical protein E6K08_02580 [Euryarchaeota archaeon]